MDSLVCGIIVSVRQPRQCRPSLADLDAGERLKGVAVMVTEGGTLQRSLRLETGPKALVVAMQQQDACRKSRCGQG